MGEILNKYQMSIGNMQVQVTCQHFSKTVSHVPFWLVFGYSWAVRCATATLLREQVTLGHSQLSMHADTEQSGPMSVTGYFIGNTKNKWENYRT